MGNDPDRTPPRTDPRALLSFSYHRTQWLFPGTRAGHHIAEQAPMRRSRGLRIDLQAARNAALSAVEQCLQLFGETLALDLNLGRGLLDSLQVSGSQLEVDSAQVLFQAM